MVVSDQVHLLCENELSVNDKKTDNYEVEKAIQIGVELSNSPQAKSVVATTRKKRFYVLVLVVLSFAAGTLIGRRVGTEGIISTVIDADFNTSTAENSYPKTSSISLSLNTSASAGPSNNGKISTDTGTTVDSVSSLASMKTNVFPDHNNNNQSSTSTDTFHPTSQNVLDSFNSDTQLNPNFDTQSKICTSENCYETARSILESLNTSVDPCQDFPQFACGGWIKEMRTIDNSLYNKLDQYGLMEEMVMRRVQGILEESHTTNVSITNPKALNEARWYYTQCMDEIDGIKPQDLDYSDEYDYYNDDDSPDDDFKEDNFEFKTTTSSPLDIELQAKNRRAAVRQCVKKISDMDYATVISYKYVTMYTDTNDVKMVKVEEILQYIIESYAELLENSWISEVSKKNMKEILHRIPVQLGYPRFFKDEKALKLLTFASAEDWYYKMSIDSGWQTSLFKTIVQPTQPLAFTAEDSTGDPVITITAGLMQMPKFGFPVASLNFGGIGTTLAHEFGHVFGGSYENTNILLPARGLDIHDFTIFIENLQCYIDQYNKYTLPECTLSESDCQVDGRLTFPDNVADNLGVRVAFMAFKKFMDRLGVNEPMKLPLLDYTPEQLFFIAYAQSWCAVPVVQDIWNDHSPAMIRPKGALHNFEQFYNTWNCPAPEPETMCRIL